MFYVGLYDTSVNAFFWLKYGLSSEITYLSFTTSPSRQSYQNPGLHWVTNIFAKLSHYNVIKNIADTLLFVFSYLI